MGTVWAFIKMLIEIWNEIKILIGVAKKVQHDHNLDNIDEKTKEISNPDSSLEDRLKAGADLEDDINSHT